MALPLNTTGVSRESKERFTTQKILNQNIVMSKFKSLRKRFYALLLLPVALLLIVFGYLGFSYSRQVLLAQWQETAMLKLERAAHQIDMRLDKFRQWLQLFSRASQSAERERLQPWILQQLRDQEGVEAVRLLWQDRVARTGGGQVSRQPEASRAFSLSPLRFRSDGEGKTLTLASDLLDQSGQPVGQLEVVLRWSAILEGLFGSGWLQDHTTSLMDTSGHFLTHLSSQMKGRKILGETGNTLELAVLADLERRSAGVVLGEGRPPETVVGYYRLPRTPWVILLFAPGATVLDPIVRFRFYYVTAGVLCLLAILVFIRQLICPIIMSIRELSRAAMQVAEGHYGQPLPEERRDELGQLTRNFNAMVAGLKERDFIKDTFGRYVDPEVARELLSRPEATLLGGERRQVVILFADLRDFTPVAESLSPEATIRLINRFFSQMIEVIRKHKGIIVDFYGDGLLAFFEPLGQDADQCVAQGLQCALEMQAAMGEINASGVRLGYPPLALGIGLHAGEAVVGNIGSETRSKYGIVGSAVNLTHRLQAKAQGGEVVLSEAAFLRISPPPLIKREFQSELKGLREPMTLYVTE